VSDLDCDVVIIGSGPGGATAAHVLSAAGWSVVVLEKGRNHLLSLEPPYGPLGHFSNDELKFTRRHVLGPDPWLEPRTFRRAGSDGDHLLVGDVNNLPSTVGGGGVHADGKLPRFREDDFNLRTALGPVDGADVVDWPIDYSDLEPYYADAERLVGVAGETTNPFAAWRSGPYPMPPGADMYGTTLSVPAAERLGLHPYRAPTGANSVPYDGRPACNNCGFCGFHGCPIEAKGDPVALLRKALQTGRCRIVPEALAVDLTLDTAGRRATGVRYLDLTMGPSAGDAPVRELRAAHVVLAGGAFETPRFLLRAGVGNSSGQVGRNLMFHFQTLSVGAFPQRVWGAGRGRAVTHLHDDHIVGDDAQRAAARAAGLPWLRGGIVEHGGAAGPVQEALIYGPGAHHGAAMRDSSLRERLWVFTMQGEDLARPDNRVDLDPTVRDAWGLPAGRVTWSPHRHELAASTHVGPLLEAVLREAGAEWTVTSTSPPVGDHDVDSPLGLAPASRHVMGTARMGNDPTSSVVDATQHLWDVENVMVADSSVFPTSTGYGPTLTLVALAARAAHLLAGTGG
jgi:choline dehydrogenase-like flavoprotein